MRNPPPNTNDPKSQHWDSFPLPVVFLWQPRGAHSLSLCTEFCQFFISSAALLAQLQLHPAAWSSLAFQQNLSCLNYLWCQLQCHTVMALAVILELALQCFHVTSRACAGHLALTWVTRYSRVGHLPTPRVATARPQATDLLIDRTIRNALYVCT